MFVRNLVEQLKTRMAEERRFIQIVTGPRQTGKTTVLLQVLESVPVPGRYVSADDPALLSPEWLRSEWEQARALITAGNGEEFPESRILVIDEVQKIPQWSAMVKLLWDEDTRRKIPLKVILSGSSSLLIQKGLTESLAGRFEVLHCSHWSYRECKAAFGYGLDDFLFFGGYPGAAALKNDEERWARYIGSSIVEPVIARDVLLMEEVRKPALLRSLFTLGARYSDQELSYTKLLGQLHDAGNTVTIAHYLELLGKANILCGLPKYSPNKLRSRGSSPRLMVYDTSLFTWAAGASRRRCLEEPGERGHLIESAVGAALLARGKEEGFEVYWWRDRDKEVDFVVEQGRSLTAIEVKSGGVKHTGGSLEFQRRFPQALSLIVGSSGVPLEDFLEGKTPLFKLA